MGGGGGGEEGAGGRGKDRASKMVGMSLHSCRTPVCFRSGLVTLYGNQARERTKCCFMDYKRAIGHAVT